MDKIKQYIPLLALVTAVVSIAITDHFTVSSNEKEIKRLRDDHDKDVKRLEKEINKLCPNLRCDYLEKNINTP